MAMSLLLAIGAISYAQDRQHGSTTHTVPSESEIAAITVDYFDGNWAIFERW
ncbi:MAG: hypothetical protein OER96_12970 [Gammaproteobacteria bacterium]|nr:hypothetical protein [Gammaproteobacteria bacterium]